MVAPAKKRPNRLCLLQESLPSSKVAFLKARYQKSLETLACHSGSRWHLFRTHSQIWNWKRLASLRNHARGNPTNAYST